MISLATAEVTAEQPAAVEVAAPARAPRLMLAEGALMFALIWAQVLGDRAAMIAWTCLTLWALSSASAAVRALVMGVVLNLLNAAVFGDDQIGLKLRWLTLAAAGAGVLFAHLRVHARTGKEAGIYSWVLALAVYILLTGVVALKVSYAPIVSIAKLLSFAWGFAVVMAGISLSREYPWRDWLHTLIAVIIFSSLPLVASPLGYFINPGWFQGIVDQPQGYAVIITPWLTYLAGVLLWTKSPRRPWSVWLVLVAGIVTVLLSHARTAVLAMALGFITTLMFTILVRHDLRNTMFARLFDPARMVIVLLLSATAVIFSARVVTPIFLFMLKGQESAVLSGSSAFSEKLFESRQRLVDLQLKNIREHPILGIGFGVASDPEALKVEQSGGVFNVPVSAATEKGVMPVAVLEETGLVGFLLLALAMWFLVWPLYRRGSFPAMLLMTTAMMLNLGEMVFFAAGAIGIWVWTYMGTALFACEPE